MNNHKKEILELTNKKGCSFCCANCNPEITYANAKTLELFRFKRCRLCGRVWDFKDLNPKLSLNIFFEALTNDKNQYTNGKQ